MTLAREGAATLAPYQGGRRLLTFAWGAAAGGLVLTLLGGVLFDGRRALFSYLEKRKRLG